MCKRVSSDDDRRGWLRITGWGAYLEQPIVIVGETPTRYRIRPADDTRIRLAGRQRWLDPGSSALVPKTAVRIWDRT